MYKLYTDKSENFVADVSVKNASLKNSTARLVVETPEMNLIFKGTIEEQKCIVPIKKLKGILAEKTTGKMYLEVIVEDIYFRPWESDFIVDEHTSMKVVVKEQVSEAEKPILEVKVEQKPVVVEEKKAEPIVENKVKSPEVIAENKPLTPAQEISIICERVGIDKNNHTKKEILLVLKEYFNANPHLSDKKADILKEFYHGSSNSKK